MITVTFHITTNSSGAYAATEEIHTRGVTLLYAVHWVDGDLADGVDAVLTFTPPNGVSTTLLTLTNANDDDWYYPQRAVDDTTGTETDYLTPQVTQGPLTLTVSNGGDTKSGKAIVYLLEA